MDMQVVITCKCERILPHIIPEFNVFLHIKVSSVHPQKYQPSTTSSETAKNWSTKGCSTAITAIYLQVILIPTADVMKAKVHFFCLATWWIDQFPSTMSEY